MLNCREVALVVEQDSNMNKIVSYILPRRSELFEDREVRNTFFSQSMGSEHFEDLARELLTMYLNKCVLLNIEEKQATRSVYKYKPVALKMKPVIGELPGEF
jgi:hypothetical protein